MNGKITEEGLAEGHSCCKPEEKKVLGAPSGHCDIAVQGTTPSISRAEEVEDSDERPGFNEGVLKKGGLGRYLACG